jgi:glycosyltransferase involved in cell wall biosynthesis
MRWLLVSKQHSPSHGGIGTYVQRFVRAAKAMNWHVEVVTQPGDRLPSGDRIHEVKTIDMQPEFAARLPQLRRAHRVRPYRYALWSKAMAERLLQIEGEFDAIEFVDCQAEGFAALGCSAIRERFAAAAFIVHAHTPMFVEETINGADESLFGRAIYHDWERRALALADGVIVSSCVLKSTIEAHCSAQPQVIPYLIDEDRSVSTSPREERILLTGSVQPRKGVDIWARSLNDVLRARPHATAQVIGPDTPTGPGGISMAQHAAKLIDPQVRDRFRWLGSLSHAQVRDAIAHSSLVVVPSRLESFSFVAAEALLAGTPVVVSDRTGIAEHVPSLPRVACDDVEAWALAQIEALSDAERSRALAMRCRAEMLKACSPSRVLPMREEMLRSLRPCECGDQRVAIAGRDTPAEMAEFVAEVDASGQESAPRLVSSVQS